MRGARAKAMLEAEMGCLVRKSADYETKQSGTALLSSRFGTCQRRTRSCFSVKEFLRSCGFRLPLNECTYHLHVERETPFCFRFLLLRVLDGGGSVDWIPHQFYGQYTMQKVSSQSTFLAPSATKSINLGKM